MKQKIFLSALVFTLSGIWTQAFSAIPPHESSSNTEEISLSEVPEAMVSHIDWEVYIVDGDQLSMDLNFFEDQEIFGQEGLLEELLEYEKIASRKNHGKRKEPKALKRTCVAQNGKASWYRGAQKTANGENYNENDLTAAHKTIPFHSLVKVTYKGRSVVVRINDAGPYISGRVIDLSRAAAKAIGIIEKGVANVQVQILRCGRG